MLSQNSQTTFMVGLFRTYYLEMVTTLVSQEEATRDLQTVDRRVMSEGIGFFTKTLPKLGKAIDRSLALGTPLQSTTGFKTFKKTKLPCFMRTLISGLFLPDGSHRGSALRDGGRGGSAPPVLETDQPASHDADSNDVNHRIRVVNTLRKLCFLFYKLETEYTNGQENKVVKDFIRADQELVKDYEVITEPGERVIHAYARAIIARVLANANPLSGIPKHGPGSVATGEMNHQKHEFKRDYNLLTQVFTLDEWFTAGPSHWADNYQQLQCLEDAGIGTAKVVLVPKDSRGPRLISCEPLEYQWVQQALNTVLVQTLEKHPLTRGQVNFTDQEINRRLALEGSSYPYGKVTLDMKEASDRVSWNLVKSLFPDNWVRALYASRSQSTLLPCGTVLPLNKFAPMGSAVCFPVEALVFWALCVSSVCIKHSTPLLKAATLVHVYGDDIIVDWDYHSTILDILPKFELLFNKEKCCTHGPFKESCGMDAYEGKQVSPIRVKKPLVHPQNPSVLASYVALSNRLHNAGFYATAHYIFEYFQQAWKNSIPVFSGTATCIGFERAEWSRHDRRLYGKYRVCKSTQQLTVRGFMLKAEEKSTACEGWFLLLRLLTEKERGPQPEDPEEEFPNRWIERSNPRPTGTYAIAHRNKLMRAWTPAP